MAIAAEIGWPVALKAQSADLSHKSDAGGVILNIADAQAMGIDEGIAQGDSVALTRPRQAAAQYAQAVDGRACGHRHAGGAAHRCGA